MISWLSKPRYDQDDTSKKYEEDNWRYVLEDLGVRRYAYWSVFAGACGHYGHNSVRQVYKKGDSKPASGAKQFFFEALRAVGSSQMQYVKKLILLRTYFERVNDQWVALGNEGEKYDRVLVTRGKDFLFAYTYTGREFKIRMGAISGSSVNAWWFNPRTGEAIKSGRHQNTGSVLFDPPGDKANGSIGCWCSMMFPGGSRRLGLDSSLNV